MESAWTLQKIRSQVEIPLVADIHFDYRLAIAAMEAGADKIRINPGNIGSRDRIKAVVDAARERNIPIRIGVNSGSLEKDILDKNGGVTAEDWPKVHCVMCRLLKIWVMIIWWFP